MWNVEGGMASNRSFVLLPFSTQLLRMKFSGYIIRISFSFCILPTSTHIVTIFPLPLHYFNYGVWNCALAVICDLMWECFLAFQGEILRFPMLCAKISNVVWQSFITIRRRLEEERRRQAQAAEAARKRKQEEDERRRQQEVIKRSGECPGWIRVFIKHR